MLRSDTTDLFLLDALILLVCLLQQVLFFTVRVMLTRFSEQHLTSLINLVVPSLIHIFTICHPELHTTPTGAISANNLLNASLQLLDVLLLYHMEEFGLHKWAFVGIMQQNPSLTSLSTTFGMYSLLTVKS